MPLPRRLLSIEMIVFVLPSTIFWVLTPPAMVLVLIKIGFDARLVLRCGGGLYGLVALWAALRHEASWQRVTLRSWQWVGLGVAASLSLVMMSFREPSMWLPPAIQIVVSLPLVTVGRLLVTHRGHASAQDA